MKSKSLLIAGLCACFVFLGVLTVDAAKIDYKTTYNMLRAKEEAERENFSEAIRFYLKEIEEHPDNGYAYLYLSAIEYGSEDYSDIFSHLDKAQRYIPKKDKEMVSLVHTLRGETRLSLGDTVAGLNDLAFALTINPDSEIAIEKMGDVAYRQKRYEDSDIYFNRLLAVNPGSYEGYMGKGRNDFARQQYDSANANFDRAIKIQPDGSRAYAFRAESLLAQKKYVEAMDDVIKSLDNEWDNKAIHILTTFPDDKSSLVEAKLKGIAAKQPYRTIWPYLTALYFHDKNNWGKAIEYYKAAYDLDLHPVFPYALAETYAGAGDYAKALEYIDQALEFDEEDHEYIYLKAQILGCKGDVEEAIELWGKYIEKKPDSHEGYYGRAFLEDNESLTDAALADYEMAVTLCPTFAYGWHGKADMLMRKNETEKAIEAYRKVVELDTVPNNESCAMYALLALGEKEKAIEFMENVIAQDTIDGGNYYDGACFYSRLGDLDKSYDNLKTAFEKGFSRFYLVMTDDDLLQLRETPAFKDLYEQYSTRRRLTEEETPGADATSATGLSEGQTVEIPFTPDNGCMSVKCTINDLPLTFIFDTGASIVSMSQLEANFMLKNGYLKRDDIIGSGNFVDANGDVSVGTVINLRNVEFGGLTLNNVRASVVSNQKAPLLLGQSVLGRLGSIKIDNQSKKLIITDSNKK